MNVLFQILMEYSRLSDNDLLGYNYMYISQVCLFIELKISHGLFLNIL